VRITPVTRLETGYSTRSGSQMRAKFQRPPLSSMPVEYLTPVIEDRAVELLTLLADRGQHRAPSIPDLIIAATAELADRSSRDEAPDRLCLTWPPPPATPD
jgi:predicted nucleic acid-binding protein